jgi:hypothetical protein
MEDNGSPIVFETLSSEVPLYEQGFMRLYSSYVRGCASNNTWEHKHHFNLVLSVWRDLTGKYKEKSNPYRLCAAAWCAKFDGLAAIHWEADWSKHVADRDGNVPFWMREVARRLDFEHKLNERRR